MSKKRAREIFDKARFVKELGFELKSIEEGYAETALKVTDKHRQQHGFVHAGVLATMADHTAGVAATNAIGDRFIILTIEFKVNFMRPADGERLRCEARVLRAGKSLVFAEAEVYTESKGEQSKLVSKALVTMSVLEESDRKKKK